MVNISLNPQFGTIEQSKNLKLDIKDFQLTENHRIYIENSSNSINVLYNNFPSEYFILKDKYLYVIKNCSSVNLEIDLNIPINSSISSISVFVIIEEKKKDDYKIVEIIPLIFNIIEKIIKKIDGNFYIKPLYISPKDICNIKVDSEDYSKIIFSVNDKRFPVLINEDGVGSVHFRGKDVLDKEFVSSVQKFPVYYYSEEDNFVEKKFSGSYLNILPQEIATYASIDVRCDPTNEAFISGEWVLPFGCIEDPDETDTPDDTGTSVFPTIPSTDIPISNKDSTTTETGADFEVTTVSNKCCISDNAVASLNNGMVLHAYTTVNNTIIDTTSPYYNKNRVYITKNITTLDVPIIINRDVVISPKTGSQDFEIYVEEDIYNALKIDSDPSASDIYVLFYENSIGYQSVKVIEKDIVNENISAGTPTVYRIIGEAGDLNLSINTWLFCVNVSFYYKRDTPDRYILNLPDSLNYVSDKKGNILQVLNIDIISNEDYIGVNEESYVYLVTEAYTTNNTHQLFYYSFSVGKDINFQVESYGWKQLTFSGNNINPKIRIDKTNTLHVFWESDRSGSWQIYYGDIGNSYLSLSNSVFSTMIDKQSELLEEENKPFEYLSQKLLVETDGDAYNVIPEFETEEILSNPNWNIGVNGSGTIVQDSSGAYLNDLNITGNGLRDMAIASVSFQIAEENKKPAIGNSLSYNQINYQISFDLETTINQYEPLLTLDLNGTPLTKKDIDLIYDDWKDGFEVYIDESRSNVPIYIKGFNKFVLGRQDSVYDKSIPFIGSYSASSDPSANLIDFKVDITKDNNNLKDFMFGLLLEKYRFKATNVQTIDEYEDMYGTEGYIKEEEHVIYSGKAKLIAFIKTEDTSDNRANYCILKEFPQEFNILENKNYTVILNYVKITSAEVNNLLDTYNNIYNDRFIGNLILLINGDPKFSQSFISYLSYERNYFDIGFGIPNGGYITSDKMLPYKIDIFEDVSINLSFKNIYITSPTYTYNNGICILPEVVRDMTKFRVEELDIDNPSALYYYDNSFNLLNLGFREDEKIILVHEEKGDNDFSRTYDTSQFQKISIEFNSFSNEDRIRVNSKYGTVLYDSGLITTNLLTNEILSFDIDTTYTDEATIQITTSFEGSDWEFKAYFKVVYETNNFTQIPITMEGLNRFCNIDMGICNDLHVVWQSNLNKYWNIYCSNSENKLRPFRFNNQITNSESNSLSPDISVNRNDKRMIVWHDNRNGNFDIYSARSLNGYSCGNISCQNKLLDNYEYNITECSIEFDYTPETTDNYIFSINFYEESSLSTLFKTISSSEDLAGWYLNGSSFESIAVYSEDEFLGISLTKDIKINISYIPQKEDNIFDRILYAKLIGVVS